MISIVMPVIISDTNYRKMTLDCINSIVQSFSGIDFELIIIDNNSPLPVDFYGPNFKTIRNPENVGISKSWNQGICASTGEIIFFVNNDTIIHGKMDKLLLGFHKYSIVAPTLISNPEEIPGMFKRGVQDFFPGQNGAFFGVKRKLLQTIGAFDEDFSPMYFEDKNFFARANKAGHMPVLCRDVGCIHLGSQTTGRVPENQTIFDRNKKIYEDKMNGTFEGIIPKIETISDFMASKAKDKSLIELIGKYNSGTQTPVLKSFNKKVSVIIPTFNNSESLIQTVDSVKRQSHRNIEIIIVDDGSTDDTPKITEILETSFGCKVIKLNKNRGASFARNEGVKLATGDYYLFCDADLVMHVDLIKAQLAAVIENEASFAYGSFIRIWPDGKEERVIARDFDRFSLQSATTVSMVSLIRKNDFPGFLPEVKTLQDWELWKTILDNGGSGVKVDYPEVLFVNRMSDRGATLSTKYAWESHKKKMFLAHYNRKNLTTIIVLALNQAEKTVKCVESIYKHTDVPFKLILIDNGSSEDEAILISNSIRGKENAILIRNSKNLGFQRGVNQGLKLTEGYYCCLLNNDTEVTDGWLRKLISHLDKEPALGCISCIQPAEEVWQSPDVMKIRIPEFSTAPDYDGDYDTYNKKLESKFPGQWKENKDMVAFFCVLFKKEVLVRVGNMDEQFRTGLGGDDDYCVRMKKAGYKFGVALDTFINHSHRTTFKSIMTDNEILEIQKENTKKFRDKWKGEGHL